MTADTDWGVTVEEVSALAPHVTIGTDPAAVPDPVFIEADRSISVNEVQGWISGVAARVSLRLADLSRITDPVQRATIGKAAHDVTTNGAAWYLVTAAHPVGQINDNTTYAEILRARYETGFEELGARLDAWVTAANAKTEPGLVAGFFPTAMFPDGARF